MACSEEFIEYVCLQLSDVGVVRPRKLFGDWMIYIDEKPAVMACDNLCYVKMHPAIAGMMDEAQTGHPYPGAKEHYILDIDHRDEACRVVRKLLPEIPYPKKRKR
ncbi:MAG: transcriptional regulator [Prevotella sp.]